MPNSRWWAVPELRTAEPGSAPRRVTWLELFYDLVFVIVIGQLAHRLSVDISPIGLLRFVFLFIPAWWIWAAGTYYVEYWETDDVSIRVIMFALMLPVVGLALFIHGAFEGQAAGYAYCYAGARVVLAVIFFRVGVHDRESRTIAWSYTAGFVVVAALIAFSIHLETRWRVAVWAMALATEMLLPLVVSAGVRELLPHRRETSKLPERFGLFTIIVLGETIVGVFNGLSQLHHVALSIAVVGVLGVTMAFVLWSIYFDFIARRMVRDGAWWEFGWGYAHLWLLVSIVAVGASLSHVIASGDSALPDNVRWLLAGAAASTMAAVAVIETTLTLAPGKLRRARTSIVVKLAAALAAVLLGLTGEIVGARVLMGILLVIMSFPLVGGVSARAKRHRESTR